MTISEILTQLELLGSDSTFSRSYLLMMSTLSILLDRRRDDNVAPHVHVILSFFSSLASIPHLVHLLDKAPWDKIVAFLNTLFSSERQENLEWAKIFPTGQADVFPLPEDYLIRGQLWSQWYFPAGWFDKEHGEEARSLELASTVRFRNERIVQLGYNLASVGLYDMAYFSI